ncbi:MAG: DNA topoisomerase IB [Actinomycetota bacterium]|nr:DNA topoisomerase IB [Actinomycetota bacterium]
MARLRRVDCSGPGITRRRRGRGFEYLDEEGKRLGDPEALDRIRSLTIPPAWKEVWICPYPTGHIQATGVDAAGRKQYIYHPRWRERRDQEKFEEMIGFARALPRMREAVAADLRREDMPRERVLACAVRLLDRGFVRVGGEAYAAENDSYGLATIHKRHVTVTGDRVKLDYRSKSGMRRVQEIVDADAAPVVEGLKRRRGGSPELLAFKRDGRWQDVKSTDINEYLKDLTGGDFTAKDFRTWNATVLAAVALAVSGPVATSRTARKRAVTRAVKEVAHYLGNTPAVCRASYIDPRVFDRYEGGLTIGGALPELGGGRDDGSEELSIQGPIEEAVIDLLAHDDTPAIERVA